MAIKQLSYTAEQIDDAVSKKDLLKNVSMVNAVPSDVADKAIFVNNEGAHKGTLITTEKKTYSFSTTDQIIPANSIFVGAQTINKLATQSKTVSIDTEEQLILPDEGKVLNKVIINRIPTDAIGSKYTEVEKKIITPTVYDVNIVPEGTTNMYLRNNKVTIKGDTNLRSENIKLGQTIFGITGSYESDPNMQYPASDGKVFKSYGLVGNINWSSICFGNGKFVAVANGENIIAYSTDGTNWTQQKVTNVTDYNFSALCYGSGKFVAISSNSNKIIYSLDGINWESVTLPTTDNWSDICYGSGKFIAVASNSSKALYSLDGVNWQLSTMPIESNWKGVAYGNGMFVAVTYDSTNIIAYTSDAINWTQSAIPEGDDDFKAICYGGDKFVTITSTGSSTAYSTDGINWNRSTLPYSNWTSICYGNGKFVAVSDPTSYDRAAYSTDGINWSQTDIGNIAIWQAVCYGAGKFVAVGRNSSSGLGSTYSVDGSQWGLISTLNTNIKWESICHGNGVYVTLGNGNTSAMIEGISYSYNGTDWNKSAITGNIAWKSICYGNGKFIAVGDNTNSITSNNNISPIAISYDGITWIQPNTTFAASSYLYDIVYGNGKYVTIGNNLYAYSLDGVEWHITQVSNDLWRSVCYGNGRFISIGNNALLYSNDGVSWTQGNSIVAMMPNSICYGDGKFVAVGYDVTDQTVMAVAYSTDGINWVKNTSAIGNNSSLLFSDVCYGNGKFVAVGQDGGIGIATYSIDTINWTKCELNTTSILKSICYGQDKFIAVGVNPVTTINSSTTLESNSTKVNKMTTPNITSSNNSITINAVSNANGYEVIIIGRKEFKRLFTQILKIELNEHITEKGDYVILVRACGAGYISSDCAVSKFTLA